LSKDKENKEIIQKKKVKKNQNQKKLNSTKKLTSFEYSLQAIKPSRLNKE
jgi:hypothetical protein